MSDDAVAPVALYLFLGFCSEELVFPEAVMTDPGRFDWLVAELTYRATNRPRGSAVPGIDPLLRAFGLSGRDADTLRNTFALLCTLHDDRRNHVWGYYVRNLVRPLWLFSARGQGSRYRWQSALALLPVYASEIERSV